MQQVIPGPPHHIHTLENTVSQATDYALCTVTVAHQALAATA